MNTDLSAQMVAMNSAQSRNSIQVAVFKKAQETQSNTLETLMQQAVSAAQLPAGQGLRLDKTA